ncbi:sugar phosphate isomerase/epimerase family protein [Streptomyces sp. GbtcB7]|uniref:sugar phosphate isomerase/epimerase family protein n=1 Tax=Streptomyces sp. GbtcB7 TaxID=2824752 RepID=UPI0027E3B844|nr:sugar phosphate isomerase/epimerase family protein [Streptomyces sp. GbtcB7]
MTELPWPIAYTVSSDDCSSPAALGHQSPYAKALAEVAALGYEAVEVQVREPGPRSAERLQAVAGATGVRIAAIATGPVHGEDGLTLIDPDPEVRCRALRRLTATADLAAELGVPMTLGKARGRFAPGLEERQRVWALASVRDLAGHLAARGSRLLLEPQRRANTDFLTTADQARAFATDVGEPGIGLVLDTHHMAAEGEPFAETVDANADWLACVQLADSHSRGPLGSGHFAFDALLGALRRTGFSGWITMEHHQVPTSAQAAERSLETLRKAFA